MDKPLSEVIDLAIQREEEAYDFYMDIISKLADSSIKDTIEFIANEEKKHKAFLVNYRKGDYGPDALRMTDVVDYKISQYLEEPEITKETKREDIYLIASHRELRSHQFYTKMANMHEATNIKDMLLKMANEELKHKEKMEYLYANTAFPQTAGG
ncbi:MAG: ferritin family protein [Desulfobacterales bacterium]|jgi:rubrerythrin